MAGSQIFRFEVSSNPGLDDARALGLLRVIESSSGVTGVIAVEIADLYFIASNLPRDHISRLFAPLLCDPVLQTMMVSQVETKPSAQIDGAHTIEVMPLPGVTDSAAESLRLGAMMAGAGNFEQIAVGQRFLLRGSLNSADARKIAERLIANTVVQSYAVDEPVVPPFAKPVANQPAVIETVSLRDATDEALTHISRVRRLSLDLPEMRAISAYYRTEQRDPTDVEIEMLAQTWSEHCVHKTFRASIAFTDGKAAPREIDGLLKTYIRAATDKIAKPWVLSAFVDNAGIVAFNDEFDIAFKVETHNHPSALEPFGGANTGVGGVVRDVIGVSARPIANTDVLCFGPADMPFDGLPAGVMHPRRIAEGVVHGIEDYGNKMGIPTVNGAFCFDAGYTANPLVFCGCLGLLPKGSHPRQPNVGDLIVVIGGATGRDGIRGATFSSMEMGTETADIAGSSVQIGHPIHEKQTLEAILVARDERLYTAITDCGAGGLSSAIGEMAAELGAVVHLDRVPLKYAGLQPWEIWLSEAQERMVLAVPPAHWPRVQEICDGFDIGATSLGHFTGDQRIRLLHGAEVAADLSTVFLNDGIPRMRLTAAWTPAVPASAPAPPPATSDLTADLLALLARPGTRSNEDIVRRYDHEVQGGTVVKPFVGVGGKGPGDAAVICPQNVWRKVGAEAGVPVPGVALAVGINPTLGKIDPYAMAWATIDEAIRNCVAVGADPDRIAILDNFCWGNPRLPDRLGSLVRCCEGCHDAAMAYGTPFVSGKDSLNNEFLGADGKKHAIPGTLLISAMGIVPDIARSVTSDFKAAGNGIFVLGATRDEMAASAYHQMAGLSGGTVPAAAPDALANYRALHKAIRAGYVRACHDCSEGGIALALAEMAMGGCLGADVTLDHAVDGGAGLPPSVLAFSETLGRLVIEVSALQMAGFEAAMAGHPVARIGTVTSDPNLRIGIPGGRTLVTATVAEIEHAYRGHLTEAA